MYHLIHIVAFIALASALIMLALSIVLALLPSLFWHHHPHCACRPCCAGVVTLVVLVLPLSAAWSTTLSAA
jgi:hypothetical protein